MEALATHYGLQTPLHSNVHETGPEASQTNNQALEVIARNTTTIARLSEKDRAYLLAMYCYTIDCRRRAFQAMAALPDRFGAEARQRMKMVKIELTNPAGDVWGYN